MSAKSAKNDVSLSLKLPPTPKLTSKEEKFLGKLMIEKKNSRAREMLIIKNLYLAEFIAKQMAPNTSLPFDDILQSARLGLIDAVDKYDYRRKRFSTFAAFRIKGAVLDEIRKSGKLGYGAFRTIKKISEAAISIATEKGENNSEELIANLIAKTCYSTGLIKWALDFLDYDFSIVDSVFVNIEEIEMESADFYSNAETKLLLNEELAEKTSEANAMLALLSSRQKEAIISLYGINSSYKRRTYKEAGKELGLKECSFFVRVKKGFKRLGKKLKIAEKDIAGLFEQICDIYQILQSM